MSVTGGYAAYLAAQRAASGEPTRDPSTMPAPVYPAREPRTESATAAAGEAYKPDAAPPPSPPKVPAPGTSSIASSAGGGGGGYAAYLAAQRAASGEPARDPSTMPAPVYAAREPKTAPASGPTSPLPLAAGAAATTSGSGGGYAAYLAAQREAAGEPLREASAYPVPVFKKRDARAGSDDAAGAGAAAAAGAGSTPTEAPGKTKVPGGRTAYVAAKFADARSCLEARGFALTDAHCAASAHAHLTGGKLSSQRVDVVFDNAKSIEFGCVAKEQVVNHMIRTHELGRKSNLARHLRNLSVSGGANAAQLRRHFPRCWVVEDATEMLYFMHDFAAQAARQVGASYLASIGGGAAAEEAKSKEGGESVPPVPAPSVARVRGALSIWAKWVRSQERFKAQNFCCAPRSTDTMTPQEWAWVSSGLVGEPGVEPAGGSVAAASLTDDEVAAVTAMLAAPAGGALDASDDSSASYVGTGGDDPFGTGNVWILKPNNMSKGAGIEVFRDIGSMLDCLARNEYQMVAQKYVERPLVVRRKKVDVRQWVLVTDVNPLTLWFFDAAYVRFSAADYTLDDLEDKFVHLCNNSVAQHSELYKDDTGSAAAASAAGGATDVPGGDDASGDGAVRGSMWTSEQLRHHLMSQVADGSDPWWSVIRPQMERVAALTVKSVQPRLQRVGTGFEWLGIDFLVDELLGVHLLEVNISPDISRTTAILRHMVPAATEHLFNVVLDEGGAQAAAIADFEASRGENFFSATAFTPPASSPMTRTDGTVGEPSLPAELLRWRLVYREDPVLLSELGRVKDRQTRLLQQQTRASKTPLRVLGAKCAAPRDVVAAFDRGAGAKGK